MTRDSSQGKSHTSKRQAAATTTCISNEPLYSCGKGIAPHIINSLEMHKRKNGCSPYQTMYILSTRLSFSSNTLCEVQAAGLYIRGYNWPGQSVAKTKKSPVDTLTRKRLSPFSLKADIVSVFREWSPR
ncbi:hypothetical protein DPMN_056599 [Dreissena polymorpha]|uniref:Uncharacterized protein n=1 Tax=Dreissena polymorpha TaxID=45954 RepID=A0A9D4CS07_DREPO|nr:hypothetical protein DPMN_056599 [Dreissena polymorpha]